MSDLYKKFLTENGRYLEDTLGVKEWALKRADALQLLKIIAEEQRPCLGGDVIFEDNEGALGYTNDNWHYIRDKDDTNESYITNSIAKAENYIKNYREHEGKKYYYVIVNS